MASLAREAEDSGALLAPRHRVTAVRCAPGDFRLRLETPDGTVELACERLINAAGLGAVPLVAAMEGFPTGSARTRASPRAATSPSTARRPANG